MEALEDFLIFTQYCFFIVLIFVWLKKTMSKRMVESSELYTAGLNAHQAEFGRLPKGIEWTAIVDAHKIEEYITVSHAGCDQKGVFDQAIMGEGIFGGISGGLGGGLGIGGGFGGGGFGGGD